VRLVHFKYRFGSHVKLYFFLPILPVGPTLEAEDETRIRSSLAGSDVEPSHN